MQWVAVINGIFQVQIGYRTPAWRFRQEKRQASHLHRTTSRRSFSHQALENRKLKARNTRSFHSGIFGFYLESNFPYYAPI